jgi:hypothetical protein
VTDEDKGHWFERVAEKMAQMARQGGGVAALFSFPLDGLMSRAIRGVAAQFCEAVIKCR